MKKSYLQWFFVLGMGISLGACSDDEKTVDPGTGPVVESRYVVASTPIGSSGVADYLLTTSDLSQGTISTVGKGIEQDGSYRYYLTLHAQRSWRARQNLRFSK
jgi:hypothetical protein